MAKSWDNANYQKRVEITIQSANVDSNLTDFPVLIVLSDSEAIANADMASKRYEFYDDGGTKLAYDEDSYTEGASYVNAEIWVNVGSVYASPSGDQNSCW